LDLQAVIKSIKKYFTTGATFLQQSDTLHCVKHHFHLHLDNGLVIFTIIVTNTTGL